MDFRNILQSLNTLTEGDVSHKAGPGGYGNRHGSETQTDQYGKPIGKVSLASLAPKDDKPKTRGRPVDPDKPKTGKDDPKNKKVGDIFGRTTGDVPKGKKGTKFSKMGDADKAEKKAEKKKSLKEFIDVVEANKQLDESEVIAEYGMSTQEPVQIKPATQTNTQVIQQGNKTLGTVTNPQLAAQIKQSIGKGEMTLNPNDQEMAEATGLYGPFTVTINTGERPQSRTKTKKFRREDDAILYAEDWLEDAPQYVFATAKVTDPEGNVVWTTDEQGVAEGYQLDEGAIETITALAKKIPGIGKYYQMAQQYKPQLIEILKTSKSGKEVKQKMEQLAAGQSATVAESGMMKQLGGLAVGGGSILSTMWMNAMGLIDGVLALATAGEVGGAVASGSILGLIPITLMLFAAMLMFKGSKQSSDEKARAFQAQRGQQGVAEGSVEESGLQAYLGNKKYGKDGMNALRRAGQNNASEKKMQNIRAKYSSKEDMVAESIQLTEGELKQTMLKFFDELSMGPKGYNINTAVDVHDKGLATSIINKTLAHGRFKAMSGTFKDQLRDAALEHFGFTNYDESLEEADLVPHPSKDMYRQHAIQHGVDTKVGDPTAFKPSRIQTPKVDEPTPWSRDPIAAASDRAINFISGLGKPKSKLKSTEMKDVQLESWEKELNNLLNEGITVSTSTGQQGAPDSVSINATDNDANELLNILRQSGMGVFGGNDKPTMTPYGVVSQGEEEPTGTGTEPEMSPEVVGDGDDMLSLIKKMSGLSAGPVGQEPEGTASSDYEDEEGPEEQSADTEEPEQDSEEKTDEGNAFSGAVAKAKQDGIQPGEKINVGGKEYPVKEDEMEEGNKFTGNLAKARAQGKSEADLDGDGDMEKVKEGHDHEMCNECGGMMYEGHTCEEEQVEEGFSNDAGGDAMADTELAKLKALLTMGDDLHKMKRSQSVGNPTQVSMAESLAQWKRLSGIK